MFEHIARHEVLSGLSLESLSTVTRFIPHLKRDILQPQSSAQSNPHIAPDKLSSSLIAFMSGVLGISGTLISDLWTIIREEVWNLPAVPLSKSDYMLFKEHGWEYGIGCVLH